MVHLVQHNNLFSTVDSRRMRGMTITNLRKLCRSFLQTEEVSIKVNVLFILLRIDFYLHASYFI